MYKQRKSSIRKLLVYERNKFFLQRRNQLILTTIFLVSGLYAMLLAQKGLSGTEIILKSLTLFRPLGWLLCCYVICDILGSDYHYKTLKNILPYMHRSSYLMVKIFVSGGVGIGIFAIHLLTTTAVSILSGDRELQWSTLLFPIFLGVVTGVSCLVGVFLLSMTLFENEDVAVGFSVGIVILLFILESIEPLTDYLPTLWLLYFPDLFRLDLEKLLLIILIALISSSLIFFFTIWRFKRKDIFL